MKLLLKRLTLLIASVLLLLSIFAGWVVNTESGFQWLYQRSESYLPKEILLQGVSGKLSSKVAINRFEWRDQNNHWIVNKLVLECNWKMLFQKKLSCGSILARDIIQKRKIPQVDNRSTSSTQSIQKSNSNDTDVLAQPLSELLPQIELPISFALKRIEVNQIELLNSIVPSLDIKQSRGDGSSNPHHQVENSLWENYFSRVSLKQFNKVKVDDLKVSHNKIQFKSVDFNDEGWNFFAKANLTYNKNWPYQIELTAKSNSVEISFNSRGYLIGDSQFTIQSRQPLKVSLAGNWNWKEKLTLFDTTLTADELSLSKSSPGLQIAELNSKISLSWPTLAFEYRSNLVVPPLTETKLKASVKVENLLSWQDSASFDSEFQININEFVIKEFGLAVLFTEKKNNKDKSVPHTTQTKSIGRNIPLRFDLHGKVKDSEIKLKTTVQDNGLLRGEAEFSANLIENSLASLIFNGKLSFAYKQKEHSLPFNSGAFDWVVVKNDNNWTTETSGNLNEVKLDSWHAEVLKWNLELSGSLATNLKMLAKSGTQIKDSKEISDKLNGKINIEKLSYKDKQLGSFVTFLTGTPREHQLQSEFNFLSGQKASLKLLGKLGIDNSNNEQQSKNLTTKMTPAEVPKTQGHKSDKDNWLSINSWHISKLSGVFPSSEAISTALKLTDKASNSTNDSYQSKKPVADILLRAKDLYVFSNGISIEEACIERSGLLCAKAKMISDNWSVNWKLTSLEINTINQLLKHFQVETPVVVSGTISGKGEAKGKFAQHDLLTKAEGIEMLNVDMSSDSIEIEGDDWYGAIDGLLISSESADKTNLTANWNSLRLEISPKEVVSEFLPVIAQSHAEGQLVVNFDDYNNIDYAIKQKQLAWIVSAYERLSDKTSRPAEHGNSENSSGTTPGTASKVISTQTVSLTGGLRHSRLTSALALTLSDSDYINASLETNFPIVDKNRFKGDLSWSLSNWEWLNRLVPSIDKVSGSWNHKAKFEGELDNYVIDGVGALKIDRFVIEEMGIDIASSELRLNNNGYRVNLAGELKNQNGVLKVNGHADLKDDLQASLNLSAHKLLLLETDNHKIVVSPNVDIELLKKHFLVKGLVEVDEAKVAIASIPKQAVKVSEDEVIISQQTKSSDLPFTYEVEMDLSLKDKVYISGLGLNSRIAGKLKAQKKSGTALKLNGRINLLEGEFEAYRQKLKLEEGQLLFLGPVENPGIQFKAVRKIEDTTVGIIADGSLINPQLTLYSAPAMAEENILSLLLTGRSLESLTQNDANALANAAIELGVERANRIVHKLSSALGIKNIKLKSSSKADSTRVEIGAQINEKLSLGYGTTINSDNEFKNGWILEYFLTPSLSLEAVSGEETSTYITYKKQFDPAKSKKD